MKERWVGLGSGVLFALGLSLSGMTDPGKVLGFLHIAGRWDPTLAFVMGGAVGFHALWLRLAPRRADAPEPAPLAGRRIDTKLVAGAALFGAGWGLAGYCPGPAVVSAAFGRLEAALFLAAMVAGVLIHVAVVRRSQPRLAPAVD